MDFSSENVSSLTGFLHPNILLWILLNIQKSLSIIIANTHMSLPILQGTLGCICFITHLPISFPLPIHQWWYYFYILCSLWVPRVTDDDNNNNSPQFGKMAFVAGTVLSAWWSFSLIFTNNVFFSFSELEMRHWEVGHLSKQGVSGMAGLELKPFHQAPHR